MLSVETHHIIYCYNLYSVRAASQDRVSPLSRLTGWRSRLTDDGLSRQFLSRGRLVLDVRVGHVSSHDGLPRRQDSLYPVVADVLNLHFNRRHFAAVASRQIPSRSPSDYDRLPAVFLPCRAARRPPAPRPDRRRPRLDAKETALVGGAGRAPPAACC